MAWLSDWRYGLVVAVAPCLALAVLLPALESGLPLLHVDDVSSTVLWVLVFPVLEERVFRGMLQRELMGLASLACTWRALPGLSAANLIASLCFTAAHLLVQQHWQALLVLLPSLVLGVLYERYRSVLAVASLHVWFNLCWFALSAFLFA